MGGGNVKSHKIVGWAEWVSLPDFEIPRIKAKLDTGARTSALHAEHIRIFKDEHERRMVSFTVYPGKTKKRSVRVTCPLKGSRLVKSSNGTATLRPVISTTLVIDGDTKKIEVTLINRDPMEYRMILGRQALQGLLIDSSAQLTLKLIKK